MSTYITDLQRRVLGAMRDKPITGIDLRRACDYAGGERSFSGCLRRMLDKRLIEFASMMPISYVATDLGRAALTATDRGDR